MYRKITVAFGYFISKVLYIPLIVLCFMLILYIQILCTAELDKQWENIHETL